MIRKKTNFLDEIEEVEKEQFQEELAGRPKCWQYRFFVYEWFDGDQCFYVGQGNGSRHEADHGRDYCQTIREKAANFRIELVADRLTQEEACQLEKERILLRKAQKMPIVNTMHNKPLSYFERMRRHRETKEHRATRDNDYIKNTTPRRSVKIDPGDKPLTIKQIINLLYEKDKN
jgi:hypothetical protein